jgi:hypothetical protein
MNKKRLVTLLILAPIFAILFVILLVLYGYFTYPTAADRYEPPSYNSTATTVVEYGPNTGYDDCSATDKTMNPDGTNIGYHLMACTSIKHNSPTYGHVIAYYNCIGEWTFKKNIESTFTKSMRATCGSHTQVYRDQTPPDWAR